VSIVESDEFVISLKVAVTSDPSVKVVSRQLLTPLPKSKALAI